MIYLIPKENLEVIPWDEKEKFLVLKTNKTRIMISGLKKYFKNQKEKYKLDHRK